MQLAEREKGTELAWTVDLKEIVMDGAHFAELNAFMAIYQKLSFRAAALQLGITPSALSRTLRRLEDRIGVRLFNRTTRSVSPTAAGHLLYGNVSPVISTLEQAVHDAVAPHGAPVGKIRLNLPRLAAELLLVPRLADFVEQYPGVTLEMVIDDSLSDIVAEGFDAGIRIGERLARDMIAVRLTPAYRVAVVGSPGYIRTYGSPETPSELSAHRCMVYRWAKTGQTARWSFTGPDGPLNADVRGTLILNDTGIIRDLALSGVGLAYLPEASVQNFLTAGTLVRVLNSWCKPFPGFYLYHTNRRQTPPGLRALIDFLSNV